MSLETASPPQRRLAHPRHLLLATTLALLAGGLVMILSASSVEAFKLYGSSFLFFKRQLVGTVLGLALMLGLAAIDYRRLRRLARPLFAVVLVLLTAVLIPWVGVTRGGSSRWLAVGPFNLQPSELAKISLILVSAHILAK
ncbi:MAG: FtsW/RodA/SpoVE family cell cycle protein, partial [Actinomycetota bacterium]